MFWVHFIGLRLINCLYAVNSNNQQQKSVVWTVAITKLTGPQIWHTWAEYVRKRKASRSKASTQGCFYTGISANRPLLAQYGLDMSFSSKKWCLIVSKIQYEAQYANSTHLLGNLKSKMRAIQNVIIEDRQIKGNTQSHRVGWWKCFLSNILITHNNLKWDTGGKDKMI